MKKLAIYAASSALIFAACSGDETTNVTEVTESTGLDVVAKGEKMPACDTANVGQMIFVTDSSAVFYCADGEWTTLNGKDGENGKAVNGKNGTSCTAKEVDEGIEVSCGDKVVGTIKNGKDGEDFVAVYDTVTTEFLNQEMLAAGEYDIFVDKRDNKVYRTVEIGKQVWFAQNLDYAPAGVTSYCYDNDPENCKKYGRLYYWAQANGLDDSYNEKRASRETAPADSIIRYPNQGICPNGWHVPDSTEWRALGTYVESNNAIDFEGEAVGASLKSIKGWTIIEGIAAGTDRYGFSGVAAGHLYENGFINKLKVSFWWSSSEKTCAKAVRWTLSQDANSLYVMDEDDKLQARPVRCLKD